MDLILWRHADAAAGGDDLARELTPRGREQAARVAGWLRAHLPDDYVLRVSPARRAQQTAAALASLITTEKLLAPGASVEAILKAAGKEGTVILVGHQPDLGQAIAYLLCGEARDWAVEKGALWWLAGRSVRTVVSPDLL
jgi:phosphohistidine phosphatase